MSEIEASDVIAYLREVCDFGEVGLENYFACSVCHVEISRLSVSEWECPLKPVIDILEEA